MFATYTAVKGLANKLGKTFEETLDVLRGTGKADKEALDKAAAKAVEAFRMLGANYVQIAQAVTKAMAEAVEAES